MNLEKELLEIEEKAEITGKFVGDYLEGKEEANIFVNRTRENMTVEFIKDLEEAIMDPLV